MGDPSSTPSEGRALEELARSRGISLRRGVLGSSLTTIAVGGPLTVVEPVDQAALQAVCRWALHSGTTLRVLGGGSNLLIPDAGCDGVVVRLGKEFNSWKREKSLLTVGAGFSLMRLSRIAAEAGLSGLEFAGGIPASCGGAVFMNAGAHGGDMSQLLTSVLVMEPDGETHRLTPAELSFSYRHSGISPRSIIMECEFELVPSEQGAVERLRSEFLAERKRRQPLQAPSCGSVFRNPSPEVAAGALLERAGMKGRVEGGAMISALHANWIINPERKAKASDIIALIRQCQEEVERQSNIHLVPEVVRW